MYEKRLSAFLCVFYYKLQLQFAIFFFCFYCLGFDEKTTKKPASLLLWRENAPPNKELNHHSSPWRVEIESTTTITATTTVERKARVSIKRIIYNAHEEARRKLLLLETCGGIQ